MKLTYYNETPSNFGDELNTWMWPQLLPKGFLDADPNEIFLGIGSILWDDLPKSTLKHVMGSGYGSYTNPPDVSGPDWNVVWLRGPVTAKMVNADPNLAITDSAVLVRETQLPDPVSNIDIAFMPHFQSVGRGKWDQVCAAAGITFLDPREDPVTLMAKIRGANLVITEAMHGAIVSDALRTPWIGVKPFSARHRPKWKDWAQSLDIDLRWADVSPSSLCEAYTRYIGREGTGMRTKLAFDGWHARPINTGMIHMAARQLQVLADNFEPQLSGDAQIETATGRCMEALYEFTTRRLVAA